MKSSTEPCRFLLSSFSCAAKLRRGILRHAVGQVAVNAAGPVIRGVHARARSCFIHVEQVFALPEAVQENRHRAEIEAVRREGEHVREQPRDLVEHHAQILRPDRRLDLEQLLPPRARMRARWTSSWCSRSGRSTEGFADTCGAPRASRSRDAAARCADPRARSPRHRARAPSRSTPWAAGCCGPKFIV